MRVKQRDGDPLQPEPQAGGVGATPVGQLDPVHRGEVVLVVVERSHRGGRRAGDLHRYLELQRLLALAGREHPAATPEERVGGDVQVGLQTDAADELHGALAPDVAPLTHHLGLADAHDLALVKHLQPGRVPRGFVTKHIGGAGVDGDAAHRQSTARRDRRVHRITRRRGEHEIGHRLELAPILVTTRPLLLLRGLRLGSLKREDAAGQVGKGLQIPDRLEVLARQDRRKPQLLGLRVGGGTGDQRAHPFADVLEHTAPAIDPRYPGLDQHPAVDQLSEQRRLVGRGRPEVSHRAYPARSG